MKAGFLAGLRTDVFWVAGWVGVAPRGAAVSLVGRDRRKPPRRLCTAQPSLCRLGRTPAALPSENVTNTATVRKRLQHRMKWPNCTVPDQGRSWRAVGDLYRSNPKYTLIENNIFKNNYMQVGTQIA